MHLKPIATSAMLLVPRPAKIFEMWTALHWLRATDGRPVDWLSAVVAAVAIGADYSWPVYLDTDTCWIVCKYIIFDLNTILIFKCTLPVLNVMVYITVVSARI